MMGALAISLTALATAGVLSAGPFAVLKMGWARCAIGIGYVRGIRLLHEHRDRSESAGSAVASDSRRVPRRAVVVFSVAALAMLAAAPAMARSGAAVVEERGISGLFVWSFSPPRRHFLK